MLPLIAKALEAAEKLAAAISAAAVAIDRVATVLETTVHEAAAARKDPPA